MMISRCDIVTETRESFKDSSLHENVDHKFLQDLRSHSNVSFRKLYATFSPSLLGVIMRVIPEREIAEDILQDSFVKIWKSIESYDPEKGKLFTWMSRLVRNSAIDYKRGKTFAKSSMNEDIESVYAKVDNCHFVSDKSDAIGVRELMSVLSDSQKQILDLVYFHGYTQAEVSDELCIPLGTVKSKIRLAVKVLRSYFL